MIKCSMYGAQAEHEYYQLQLTYEDLGKCKRRVRRKVAKIKEHLALAFAVKVLSESDDTDEE